MNLLAPKWSRQLHRTPWSRTRHAVTTRLAPGAAILAASGILAGSLAIAPAPAAQPFSHAWRVGTHDPAVLSADVARLSQDGAATHVVWVGLRDKAVYSEADFQAALAEVEANLQPKARARRERVESERIVDFLDIPVPTTYVDAIRSTGARVRVASRWLNAVSVEATAAQLESIAALPFVSRLTPVARSRRMLPPAPPNPRPRSDAPQSGGGLDYGPSFGQLDEIQVPAVHALGYSGAGVLVCMIDTGYFKDHDTFQPIISSGRLIAEWDFINDDGETQNEPGDASFQHNHGTVTWSALGGQTPGEVYGPAHGAMFLLAKTEDVTDETPIEEDFFAAALEWADMLGVDVASASLSYMDWYTPDQMDGNTAVTTIACDIAASRNIVICSSAGNQGNNPDWGIIAAPADGDSVVSVGAMNEFREVAGFSSRGPTADGRTKPEVCARGVGTICALPTSTSSYGDASGTSLSCPLVGGAAALILEAHPDWTAMQVREALMQTADDAANPDNDEGWGRIRVLDAINYTSGVASQPLPASPRLVMGVAPNPLVRSGAIDFTVPGETARSVVLRLYDVHGRLRSVLIEGEVTPGSHRLEWDVRDQSDARLAPGVYFLRAEIGDQVASAPIVVTR